MISDRVAGGAGWRVLGIKENLVLMLGSGMLVVTRSVVLTIVTVNVND